MDLPRDKDYAVMLRVGDPYEVRVERGDITESPADAIVNAANSELLPGGGVCGAIHNAGGPTIAEECRRIRLERGPIPPGEAITTSSGQLPARYIIHTVGPIWHGGNRGEAELLSSCYRQSMRLADELKLHTIAFPAISTGIFGYPMEQAAWVAISTLIESLQSAKHLVLVFLVLFDKEALDTVAKVAFAQRKPASGQPYEVSIAHYA
jgi:O-acetyl-ADP-ribose deacetylase